MQRVFIRDAKLKKIFEANRNSGHLATSRVFSHANLTVCALRRLEASPPESLVACNTLLS